MLTKQDVNHIEISIELAKKAFDLQEVPVGCVFVYKDEIIGKGHNDVNRYKNKNGY